MILTDAGPLVALFDDNDPHHKECVAVLKRLPAEPLLSTWVCFTEAMYILGTIGGHRYQDLLWKMHASHRLVFHDLTNAEADRMAKLMAKYHDTPMDMGDASLIAVAESLSLRRIFTLDSDFRVCRLADGSALEIMP
jgi:predicted nucleic acid-binding protein